MSGHVSGLVEQQGTVAPWRPVLLIGEKPSRNPCLGV